MDADTAAALRAPFAPAQIGKLPKGGTTLDFVGHAIVTDRLLTIDPEWSWEPVAYDTDGGPLVRYSTKEASLWIRLTVAGVTRLGVGIVNVGSFELEKQLISDALRNAAMRFGVALDLWSKEQLHDYPPEPPAAPAGPVVSAGVANTLRTRLEAIGKTLGAYPQEWIDAGLPTLAELGTLPVARKAEAVAILKQYESTAEGVAATDAPAGGAGADPDVAAHSPATSGSPADPMEDPF